MASRNGYCWVFYDCGAGLDDGGDGGVILGARLGRWFV